MQLKDLAVKPQLIKITLDDEETVKEYEEAIEFYCYDRQPISEFMRFATVTSENTAELMSLCSDLILDSEGNKVMSDDKVLPTTVLIKCVNQVVQVLGK